MRLREEGALVTIVGSDPGAPVRGKHGLEATADVRWMRSPPTTSTPSSSRGAGRRDKLRRSDSVKKLVREANGAGKIVGLICHAGLVAISARIVAGKRATGSLGIKDDLVNAGPTCVDEPAFREGNLVWGRVVEDIPAFCRELVAALSEG